MEKTHQFGKDARCIHCGTSPYIGSEAAHARSFTELCPARATARELAGKLKDRQSNITLATDATANLKDNINPLHYTSHPSGVEHITITRHMSFNIGNAIKYLWRFEYKNGIEDLEKAIWYIKDEIERLKNAQTKR